MGGIVFHLLPQSFLLILTFLAVWMASVLTVSDQRSPGLVIRHSENYTSMYHEEVILGTNLRRKLKQSIVLEAEGNASVGIWSTLKYGLSHVIVIGYERPTASVSITRANGISLAIFIGKILLRGKYRVDRYTGPWLQFSRSGNVSMSILGTSLRMQRHVVLMENMERIKWISSHCSCSIKDVQFDVDDPKTDFMISAVNVGEQLKSYEERLCIMSKYFLDADIDFSNAISDEVYLKNSILRQSVIYDGYIEHYLQGEMRYNEDSKEFAPLPQPFGALQTNRMMTYIMSDFLFNSVGFICHNHNLLSCTYTQSDLPSNSQHLFNTTCSEDDCFGKLFPNASTMYPDSSVEMNVSTLEAPCVEITPGLFKVNFELRIDAIVRLSTVPLFSVRLSMSSNLIPSIKNNRICFDMQHPSTNITTTESTIGDLQTENLFVFIEQVLAKAFVPLFTKYKTNGLDLKIPEDFSISDYEWSFNNGQLILLMDLTKEKKSEPFVYLPEERYKPRCLFFCIQPWDPV